MHTPDPKEIKKEEELNEQEKKERQQQSDPQLTELKGLVDPNEPLEVEGTDNPV